MILAIFYESTQKTDQIFFSIKVDDKPLVEKSLDGQRHVMEYEFDDEDDYRLIKVVMSMRGKNQTHTTIDENGNIKSDSAVIVNQIYIDEIDVTEIFCQGLECYEHDSNGRSPKFLDEFYGYIGCNGNVSIEFSVPLYRWFLQYC